MTSVASSPEYSSGLLDSCQVPGCCESSFGFVVCVSGQCGMVHVSNLPGVIWALRQCVAMVYVHMLPFPGVRGAPHLRLKSALQVVSWSIAHFM